MNLDGLLMVKRDRSGEDKVPIVPESALPSLVLQLHEVTAHSGALKMINIMFKSFGHPRMYIEIRKKVPECPVCQLHKGNTVSKFPLWKRSVDNVGDVYAVDLLEMLRSKRGYKALLVGIDIKSNFGHAVPLKSKKVLGSSPGSGVAHTGHAPSHCEDYTLRQCSGVQR